MGMTFYKYNGAGNDFLVADNREGDIRLSGKYISEICDRHYGVGADGVMLLGAGRDGVDFTMDYYNSDGSGGMMCGNGGRCIVAFADFLGLRPAAGDGCWKFLGPDGIHRAYIIGNKDDADGGGCSGAGEKGGDKIGRLTVRLKMCDITVAEHYGSLEADQAASGWFIDTGTRHFVRMIDSPVDERYVDRQGRNLRQTPEFAPEGVNVNFVFGGNPLKVRTFEKGVEAETCACGTGITAAAAAAWLEGVEPAFRDSAEGSPVGSSLRPADSHTGSDVCPADLPAVAPAGMVHYEVDALNDRLSVDFLPRCRPEDLPGAYGFARQSPACGSSVPFPDADAPAPTSGMPLFTDIWLTGPATLVAKIDTM